MSRDAVLTDEGSGGRHGGPPGPACWGRCGWPPVGGGTPTRGVLRPEPALTGVGPEPRLGAGREPEGAPLTRWGGLTGPIAPGDPGEPFTAAAATAGGSHESVKSPRFPAASDRQASMISPGPGRSTGFLARQRSIRARSGPDEPSRAGGSFSTRYISAVTCPSPNGGRASSAKAATAPRAKTSTAGVTGWPRICSGAMNCGEPTAMPLCVRLVASAARAMPKSMTRGPSGASSTLDGFRSRWMTPAEWMACSASATPAISRMTVSGGIGPRSATACCSDGPGTYAVTSQGGVAAGSPASSSAVYTPRTRWAASIS